MPDLLNKFSTIAETKLVELIGALPEKFVSVEAEKMVTICDPNNDGECYPVSQLVRLIPIYRCICSI